MESPIFIYLIKASISLAIFYGIYMLFLNKDTFLKTRRFYLLFAIAFSMLYPTLNIELSVVEDTSPIPMYWLSEINVYPTAADGQMDTTISVYKLIPYLLVVVSIALFLKLLFQLSCIFRLRLIKRSSTIKGQKIVEMNETDFSPFSFFGWIFVNANDSNTIKLNEILAHERVHAKQLHSVDVLIAELLCICLWWNPIVWLLKKEIKINLEYLADKGVIDEGVDARMYQYALLQVSNKNACLPIINNFNVSQLKKRIMMMNKEKTSVLKSAKYLLILPVSAALLLGNAVQAAPELQPKSVETVMEPVVVSTMSEIQQKNTKTAHKKGDVYITVHKMPKFTGGESKMFEFISQNLKYPIDAQKEGVQGRVTVRFIVRKDGKVTDVELVRGMHAGCDAEALRVINAMPDWVPGEEKGAKVDCYFTLPIVFKLNK